MCLITQQAEAHCVAEQDSKGMTEACKALRSLASTGVRCYYLHFTCQKQSQVSSESRSTKTHFVSSVRQSAKPNCKEPDTKSREAPWPFFAVAPRRGTQPLGLCISQAKLRWMLEETTPQKSPRLFSCSQLSPRKAGVPPGQRTSAAPRNLSRPWIGFHLLLKIQLPFECSICNPQVGERECLQDPAGGFRGQAWLTSYALAWTLLSFHGPSDCKGKLYGVKE